MAWSSLTVLPHKLMDFPNRMDCEFEKNEEKIADE
jgi:hypothetical protein